MLEGAGKVEIAPMRGEARKRFDILGPSSSSSSVEVDSQGPDGGGEGAENVDSEGAEHVAWCPMRPGGRVRFPVGIVEGKGAGNEEEAVGLGGRASEGAEDDEAEEEEGAADDEGAAEEGRAMLIAEGRMTLRAGRRKVTRSTLPGKVLRLGFRVNRGTSLIRNSASLGPYSSI